MQELCETHEAVGRTVVVVVGGGGGVGSQWGFLLEFTLMNKGRRGRRVEKPSRLGDPRRSRPSACLEHPVVSRRGTWDTRARQNHTASNFQGNSGRTKDQTAA